MKPTKFLKKNTTEYQERVVQSSIHEDFDNLNVIEAVRIFFVSYITVSNIYSADDERTARRGGKSGLENQH